MPLKLNVGLSQKLGDNNYGSRGASVNVELELESGLVNEQGKLQERIRQIFGLVRTSLAEELNGSSNGHAAGAPANGNKSAARSSGQDPQNGASRGAQPRAATQSQIKALYAITKDKGLNLNQLLRERFRVGKPEQLSIREASQLIDELKGTRQEGDGS